MSLLSIVLIPIRPALIDVFQEANRASHNGVSTYPDDIRLHPPMPSLHDVQTISIRRKQYK
jgi:hypothetical protein